MATKQYKDMLSLCIVLFSMTLISACGGGGGGGPLAGSTTATVSSGEIEGFGSIIVNGVRFDTDSAEIEMENEAAAGLADLHEGMQVTVEGTTNGDGATGTATRVRFEDNLEGPITSVTPSDSGFSKNLMILGQMVSIEQGVTLFDNSDPSFNFSSLGAANVGNVVEVSGHDMADGSIQATFIQKKADTLADFLAAGQELEIKGSISNLNTAASTFQIGGLFIDYSNATLFDLDNAPGGELADGLPVEVKSVDDNLADNILSASTVEVKLQGLDQDDIAKAEVEGFVTQLDTAARTFMLNGQMVNYSDAEFRGGLEVELADNMKVEAEGPISNGMLNALKITFKESIKFEANADSIAANAGGGTTLTLQGFPGIEIHADSSITRMANFIDLGSLASGSNLRVRARPSGAGGQIVATRVTLRSNQPNDRVIVQGRVDSFDTEAGTVSLLGGLVMVETNEIVAGNSNDDSPGDNDFEIEDTPVNQGAFFAALVEGDIVKARARLDAPAGDAKTWDNIEIEVEDD